MNRHQLYHSMVELPTYVDTQTTLGTQQTDKIKINFAYRKRNRDRSKDESIEHQVKLLGMIFHVIYTFLLNPLFRF